MRCWTKPPVACVSNITVNISFSYHKLKPIKSWVMTFKKKDYYTIVQQAQDAVPGFRDAYVKFIVRVTID